MIDHLDWLLKAWFQDFLLQETFTKMLTFHSLGYFLKKWRLCRTYYVNVSNQVSGIWHKIGSASSKYTQPLHIISHFSLTTISPSGPAGLEQHILQPIWWVYYI